eukprot:GFUD01031320.1.p1 GENE.GFUD01031320.1~~GFUD01031320.1.p1  ORF type:complete len:144 (-),score=18.87 GFUD01031320.1:57-488(-)
MSHLARSLCSKLNRSISFVSVKITATRTFSISVPRLDDYKAALTAKQINNDNPFDTYVLKPDAGRGLLKNVPILVPSVTETRMVGCCCEDDYQDVVWFELKKGDSMQCDCGNYFKLIDYDPLDPNIKPKFGMGFGSGLGSLYY